MKISILRVHYETLEIKPKQGLTVLFSAVAVCEELQKHNGHSHVTSTGTGALLHNHLCTWMNPEFKGLKPN